MGKATHGINPITLRGQDHRTGKPTALTLGRMHVGISGDIKKMFTVTMYDETDGIEPKSAADAEARMFGFLVLDEDHVLEGLYHLFPTGEMDHGDKAAEPINAELLAALKTAVAALQGLGASQEALSPLAGLLKRIEG